MEKRDKLPTIDPNVRGIYDKLIAAAVEVRKQRKSEEYRYAEQRREVAAKLQREAREIEAKAEEAERISAERLAEARKTRSFILFTPSGETMLSLRESDMPKFVR